MRFNDFNDLEKVQLIKDKFVSLLELISDKPDNILSILKIEEPKKEQVVLAKANETDSDQVKASVEEKNKQLSEAAEKSFLERQKAFEEKLAIVAKIKDIVKNIPRKPGCEPPLCGHCINPNAFNSFVPPELEILLEYAKKQAQEEIYQ